MHTGRVRLFLSGDGQYALSRVLGVQKTLLLPLPPREQESALKNHLAQRQFDRGGCGEIHPKGPRACGPALLEIFGVAYAEARQTQDAIVAIRLQ